MVDLTFSLLAYTFQVGDTFGFDVQTNGPNDINAAQVNIVYNHRVLELVSVEYRLSRFPTQVAEILSLGSIRMARTILGKTLSGSNIFATLNFRAIAPGQGFVRFGSGCSVVDASLERNVLGSRINSLIVVADTPGNLTLDIDITQKIQVALNPRNSSGQPALLDGVPVWRVVSGSATLVPAFNGWAAYLVAGDVPGDSQILVEADADLGQGVETISGIITLRTFNILSANMGLVASQPEPKKE